MKDYPRKEMVRNLLSVCFGVLGALAILYFAALLLLVLKVANFETIITAFLIPLAAFIGGISTVLVSTRNDMIHAAITALVLFILLLNSYGFELSAFNSLAEKLILFLIIPIVLFGGWVGTKVKEKEKKAA